MTDLFAGIRNGIVLAELGGYGDGPYVARHGKGAALVMIGTYVVDEGTSLPYPEDFIFKPARAYYEGYLKKHISAARASGAKIGVSVISQNPAHAADFLRAAEDAGADCVVLCAYSVMTMFTSVGLGVGLCRPGNRETLTRWVKELSQSAKIPFIMKMGMGVPSDTIDTVKTIVDSGAAAVHMAFNNAATSRALPSVKAVAEVCPFLIAGGGINDARAAQRLFEAGAGAVSIAAGAMRDAGLCGRLQAELRKEP